MVIHLISLKVKWYVNKLMKTLYEYSVALLLWGTIFVFGVFNLSIISKPIAIFLSSDLSYKETSLYLVVLNLIFMILYACQKNLIFNYDFEFYIQSLPISKQTDRLSSLFVLFVSNHFLWVILVLGAYLALYSQYHKTMIVFETLYLFISLLIMQLCLHEKNINKFILICVSNLMFLLAKALLSVAWFNLTMFLLGLLDLWIGFADIKNSSLGLGGSQLKLFKSMFTSPVLSIQSAMLRPFKNQLFLKVIFSIAIQLLAVIMVTHTENPNLVYFVVLLNYLTVLTMSIYSRLLALETQKLTDYFLSLPLKKYFWFKKHQIFNLIVTLLLVMPCAFFALFSDIFNIWMIIYLVATTVVINAVVYYIHLKSYRNTTLLLFLIIILFYSIQVLLR